MITDISEHIPEDFSSGSRIWIYQASRTFFMSEAFGHGTYAAGICTIME